MKRVVVFTTSYFPFIGGAEMAIREITSRLNGSFDFVIITAKRNKNLPTLEKFSEALVYRVGFGNALDKWILMFFGPILAKKYFKNSETVIWGMDISQGSFAASVLKFFHKKIPFVLSVQYGESEKYLQKGRGGFIGRSFKFMLSQSDKVTAISIYLIDLVKKYGFKKEIFLIPNGVSLEKFEIRNSRLRLLATDEQAKFETKKEGNKKIVITVSRLVDKNGVGDLIEAMKHLPENVFLWIVGGGPLETNLKLKVQLSKLDEKVIFWGNMENKEAMRKMNQADVFVRPSYSEGLGNAFLEAMRASVPIVGTRAGGIPDFLKNGETGLFCEIGNPQDIALKIREILDNTSLQERLVKNGLRLVEEKYNWDNIAREMRKVFEF